MQRMHSEKSFTNGFMRTPNCACIVCQKPLYRRPNELRKVRHVACLEHRAEAQKLSGITDAQQVGLGLGRKKGTNNRTGYKHSEASKQKTSDSHKKWAAENPERVAERSRKIRAENHYNWKGGSTKLNTSIRQMTENRIWMDAIKGRDGKCMACGALSPLESHHKKELAYLIESLNIKSREDARQNAHILWDLENGITLCEPCHYKQHNRKHHAN